MEQVVRTSVLSRRWRSLWNYSLKSLTFKFSALDGYYYLEEGPVCEAVHRGFVDRVNLILALPVVGNTIDDFNLTFWLAGDQTYWCDHLPGWIDFALEKRAKRLSIDLDGFAHGFTLDDKIIRNHNMDSLVSLCLDRVDVTGELLEHLLTICGSLEHMSVSRSTTLVDFTVSGPCLKLKYLLIHHCLNLRRLHIRRVNLVSFDYSSSAYENEAAVVIVEDAPRLVKACLWCLDKTAKVLSYLPHLQTLALTFFNIQESPLVFPKLMNLVKVELKLISKVSVSIICASLLVSCPSISELVIVFMNLKYWRDTEEKKVDRLKNPHECLKVVELVGFIGCKLDTSAALYIIENTVSLEKIVVDTSHPHEQVETRSIAEEVEREASRMETTLSESEMRELADSVSRARADRYESDMRERARARAHAREHLATRLSHTTTQIVVK